VIPCLTSLGFVRHSGLAAAPTLPKMPPARQRPIAAAAKCDCPGLGVQPAAIRCRHQGQGALAAWPPANCQQILCRLPLSCRRASGAKPAMMFGCRWAIRSAGPAGGRPRGRPSPGIACKLRGSPCHRLVAQHRRHALRLP
jgi:hypothetical protein